MRCVHEWVRSCDGATSHTPAVPPTLETLDVLACLGPFGHHCPVWSISRVTQGENTTTEFLSRAIHSALCERLPSFVGTLKVRFSRGLERFHLMLRTLGT